MIVSDIVFSVNTQDDKTTPSSYSPITILASTDGYFTIRPLIIFISSSEAASCIQNIISYYNINRLHLIEEFKTP